MATNQRNIGLDNNEWVALNAVEAVTVTGPSQRATAQNSCPDVPTAVTRGYRSVRL